jgi:hypothetical protein
MNSMQLAEPDTTRDAYSWLKGLEDGLESAHETQPVANATQLQQLTLDKRYCTAQNLQKARTDSCKRQRIAKIGHTSEV